MKQALDFSPYKLVKKALMELKTNEQKVISGRFGIDEPRKTLSAIGRALNLSRERIRQIERDGLKRLAGKLADGAHMDQIFIMFKESGGISSHTKLPESILGPSIMGDVREINSLNLILSLMPQIRKIEKTRELEESWVLADITKEELLSIIDDWSKQLEKSKKPQKIEVLLNANPSHSKYELTFLSQLPHVSKRLIKTESGHVGLAVWPEINPRNVRDKIYYVLKKANEPLHFEDIAKKINEQSFSKKKVVRATVHNELIADKRFVLVGRGIYALSEWGYKPGTVEEIIKEILSESGKLSADEIVDRVLKQRTVKKNTILINLQTKSAFTRVAKDTYALK